MPDARSLHDLAVYYEVSADYLLGLSDVKTFDMDIRSICEYTGLTPLTVSTLNSINGIIEEMISELSSGIVKFGVTDLAKAKIWKTFDEDEDEE